MSNLLADCHLHFEGSLSGETVRALARRAGHSFRDPMLFESALKEVTDAAGFLSLYAEVCGLFRSPDDYAEAARAMTARLTGDGVAYAEVFVSPEIFRKQGLPAAACLEAIASAFAESGEGRAQCRILLDVVRHWGPESGHRVLDLYEESAPDGVVGLGMGGDENAVPASAFSGVFARARSLGLPTSVHAGEWGGPESLREALDALRPDRVDHGIAAADDEALARRLAEEGTILCVSPSSNAATSVVDSIERHPLPRLLAAGVRVALCADDPLLFSTTTRREYRLARQRLGVGLEDLRRMAANAWHAAFGLPEGRDAALAEIEAAEF